MPDAKQKAADAYVAATDAYTKNQTAQGMAAAQIADKVAAPDPLEALMKKAQAGTITASEQKQLNDAIAKRNPPVTAAPLTPKQVTHPPAVAPVAPVSPPPGTPSNFVRWRELYDKKKAGTITPAEMNEYIDMFLSASDPTQSDAAKAIEEAKKNGAVGYLDPQASTESLAAGGPAVYKDFNTGESAAIPSVAPVAQESKRPSVDDVIASMKAETGKEGGPNIWDIIQAAAAGWNFQTPAYLERKKSKEAKEADIEKLSKTAQFERALQEERLAAEKEQNDAKIRAELALSGIGSIGTVPGASKGTSLGVGLMQGLGKK